MNIGVIGTFWLTDEFIKAIKLTDKVKYYGQYSRSMERAKEYGGRHGAVTFYDSLEDMANDEHIDIVYIASPNMLHYKQSKLFLEAKKHVICEKPITVCIDEFKELSLLADKNNVIYMEAMMNTHVEWAKTLKDIIKENEKGIVSARFDFSQRSSKLERLKKGEHISTFDKGSCGGALMDLGVYCTSLVTYLFGSPQKISAHAHFSEKGVDLTDTVMLEYPSFDCTFTITKLSESIARSEILLSDSAITFKNVSQLQSLVFQTPSKKSVIHGENSFSESMIYEIQDMVKYIEGDTNAYLENRKHTEMSISLLEEIRNHIGYDIKSYE